MSDKISPVLAGFSRSYLSTATFVARARRALQALTPEQWRMRHSPGAQELIDEVAPLASFLRHFEWPGRTVRCRYVGPNKPFDARVRVAGPEVEKGFLSRQYHIEITSAVSGSEYLEREALQRNGRVFLGGSIARIGSAHRGDDVIVDHPVVKDGDSAWRDVSERVRDSVARKASKGYPEPCILLVRVQLDLPMSIVEWGKLGESLENEVNGTGFAAVYVVDPWTNTVFYLGAPQPGRLIAHATEAEPHPDVGVVLVPHPG